MDKQKYIDYLNETSAKVSPFVHDMLQQYGSLDAELYDVIMFFVGRRLGKPLLKPALLRATYEVCGGKDWERVVPACAAFELINISSYQANSAFDNKLGILTKNQKDSQFIASMCTREVANECLDRMQGEFDQETLGRIANCLTVSNKYIYIAQHWDINLLTLANEARYRDRDFFLQEYTKRCHYGSGVFSGQCAYAGGLLAGANQEDLEALRGFGESYGTALHMINDLGDYVPGDPEGMQTRDYQDQYSDFRNRRLTLPLHLVLRKVSESDHSKILALLRCETAVQSDLALVTSLLLRYGIDVDIRRILSGYFNEAKLCLSHVAQSSPRPILKLMLSVERSNKYFGLLRQHSRQYLTNG